MRSAAVYGCAPLSNRVLKEALIYENIELALAALADIDKHFVPGRPIAGGDASWPRSAPPGLAHVKPAELIIALGKAAHTALADFQKRTLIAGDLDLESEDADEKAALLDEVRRFIWSCINTLKVVAVGAGAWRSVQMLPLADRRFYDVPPLRIASAPRPDTIDGILIINHDGDDRQARRLAEFLEGGDTAVECTGLARNRSESPSKSAESFCSGAATIHVHVGHHTMAAEKLRLVDTWHSRRLAVQLVASRSARSAAGSDNLLVEDEVNGFLVHAPEKVAALCAEIKQDPILRRRLLDGGSQTVAPLVKAWMAIAEDLLS